MLNTMRLEAIEHEEAEKAVKGTPYNALDLMDFQSVRDLQKQLKNADEQTARKAFKEYFKNLVIGLNDTASTE